MSAGLNVANILKTSARTWWRDLAPIVILGLGLIPLPEVVMRVIGATESAAPSTDTLVTTIRALTLLMFTGTITAATLVSRDALGPRTYIIIGLQRLQKPLITGLTLLAALVTVMIAGQLAALFMSPPARFVALPLALACLTVWFVAMPVAAELQTAPFAALRQSARLIMPVKWRVLGLIAILGLASGLVLLALALLLFGSAEGNLRTAVNELDPASVGFWIAQLAAILLQGFLSVVPATLYRALQQKGRTRQVRPF